MCVDICVQTLLFWSVFPGYKFPQSMKISPKIKCSKRIKIKTLATFTNCVFSSKARTKPSPVPILPQHELQRLLHLFDFVVVWFLGLRTQHWPKAQITRWYQRPDTHMVLMSVRWRTDHWESDSSDKDRTAAEFHNCCERTKNGVRWNLFVKENIIFI